MAKTETQKEIGLKGKKAEMNGPRNPWYSWIFRMRIEEFIALVFFLPMVFLTTKAYLFFEAQGHVPHRFVGDVQRVFGVVIAVAITLLIIKFRKN